MSNRTTSMTLSAALALLAAILAGPVVTAGSGYATAAPATDSQFSVEDVDWP